MPKIFVAMPCAQGLAKMQAVQTAGNTMAALIRAGHDAFLLTAETSDVVLIRNYFASWALHHGADKLFFIDSDMQFSSAIAMRLLASGMEVIGATYPKRALAIDRLVEHARKSPEAGSPEVLGRSLGYTMRRLDDGSLAFKDGIAEVGGIGMGATLIDVGVFRSMVESGTAKPLRAGAHADFPMFGFFDRLAGPDGYILGEDFSFCSRWRQAGGKVHLIDSAGVGHVGAFVYEGSMLEALMAEDKAARD